MRLSPGQTRERSAVRSGALAKVMTRGVPTAEVANLLFETNRLDDET